MMNTSSYTVNLNWPNFSLHWTGSSRFSLVSMPVALAAAPGQ
jgi:hypothetical protein